tara:strand:+ start:324 stop:611 length:288 start_codon:yes stop_codon:yes gene_type:complete
LRKRRNAKRQEQNLAKNLLFIIGLNVREPKEKRAAGLIATLQMAKVDINLVEEEAERKENATLLVDPHRELAKKEVAESHGAKKAQNETKGRTKQ